VLNAPATKARLSAQGIDVVTSSPQALTRLIREDYERWGKVVRATGIKAE
jgi:tripartite-type tricarboxylate transporter receptor subunit TctC